MRFSEALGADCPTRVVGGKSRPDPPIIGNYPVPDRDNSVGFGREIGIVGNQHQCAAIEPRR
jgi:hypothetical protein